MNNTIANPACAEADQRLAAAYHEAGHAVAALLYGWWINDKGVYITEDPPGLWLGFCGTRCRLSERTKDAVMTHLLAGWLAEHSYHGHGLRSDDELDFDLAVARGEEEEPFENTDGCPGDDVAAFTYLLERQPAATDAALKEMYRRHEARTLALIRTPGIWAVIERLARALHERGHLNAAAVHELADADLADHRLDC